MAEIWRTKTIEPDPGNDAATIAAETLLVDYSFELGHYLAEELVRKWLKDYPAPWLRLAIIEALYQGRYKSISVEQILVCWHRRSKPIYHFNLEFERLICAKSPGDNLPEEESKTTPKDVEEVAAEEESLAEVAEEVRDRAAEVYTINPPIAPMISKYQPNLTQETTQETELATPSETEEQSPAILSFETEEYRSEEKKISEVKPTPKKKLSKMEIQRQIINNLLKDPWLDEGDEAAIQSILNSGANSANAELAPVTQNEKVDKNLVDEKSDLVWPETPNGIDEFNPTVESSEFYDRLQSVLEHKLNNPDDEPRKR